MTVFMTYSQEGVGNSGLFFIFVNTISMSSHDLIFFKHMSIDQHSYLVSVFECLKFKLIFSLFYYSKILQK